ncbi:hypothetical protein HDU91_000710 [Kappamyces sp. JEL0680]|nr:hypothetical protein HDU91_000710 [Kappamyces sp. JEL0680]
MTLKDILAELKIQCQSQSMTWLKQFMECGGLTNLFAVLDSMHAKPGRRAKHYEIESDTLKILRLIANHDSGITDILCQQNFLNILILSLDSPLLMARTATIDFLLAIVTLNYPTGHQLVMSAMDYFKTTRKKSRIFDCLVESLANAVTSRGIFGSKVGAMDGGLFGFGTQDKIRAPSERDIRDFLVSATALVRFLVEIPPEFEYRMHLRHELISSGIIPVFQKLTTWASSEFHDVLQHVVAFENLKTADFKYLLTNMDSELDIDIDDPNQLLSLLKSKLDPDDTRTVTSLIQNIVVGTSLIDSETRSYMLSMIEKAVTYIVLDQNGITNFTDAFKYSVDQIISGLQEIELLRDENANLIAICDHQEKQLLNGAGISNKETRSALAPAVDAAVPTIGDLNGSAISLERLQRHKTQLDLIRNALKQQPAKAVSVGMAETMERKDSDITVTESARGSVSDLSKVSTVPPSSKPPPPPRK